MEITINEAKKVINYATDIVIAINNIDSYCLDNMFRGKTSNYVIKTFKVIEKLKSVKSQLDFDCMQSDLTVLKNMGFSSQDDHKIYDEEIELINFPSEQKTMISLYISDIINELEEFIDDLKRVDEFWSAKEKG